MQNRWRLSYQEIIYVGDNLNKDFLAPKQLGMKVLWFKNPDCLYSNCLNGNEIKNVNSIKEIQNELLK